MVEPIRNLPKEKQTVLGLYAAAKEAYEKWKTDPDKVMILDVRTPESLFQGQRLKNGWKNSGSPWIYELTPERLVLPKSQ